MTLNQFTVATAQINPRLGDIDANLQLYAERVRAARGMGADLVVFPELSLTGYFLKDMVSTVALPLGSPEVKKLKDLSRKIGLIAGLVEETNDYHFYNSAVYFEDGEIVHVHRKVYLPTYGLFDEGRYFARGNRIRSFDSKFGRCAMLICEDLWHPSTAYVAALDHALTVFCPSTSPLRGFSDDQEQDNNARYWELLNAMYAQTFSQFIVYANRVGFEDGVGFWGGSEVVDPTGVRLCKAKYYEEDLIFGEIHLKDARRQRVASPLLRDEDVDLTINELLRIRGRELAVPAPRQGRTSAASPAPVKRAPQGARVARTLKSPRAPRKG
ncbi:MAG: nitrilase-related carbon-nitrogen hydrolase [Candidatus Binatia bacterium]